MATRHKPVSRFIEVDGLPFIFTDDLSVTYSKVTYMHPWAGSQQELLLMREVGDSDNSQWTLRQRVLHTQHDVDLGDGDTYPLPTHHDVALLAGEGVSIDEVRKALRQFRRNPGYCRLCELPVERHSTTLTTGSAESPAMPDLRNERR